MNSAPSHHPCPVCGFPGLTEAPWTPGGGGSYEICPSCGFQFGVDDEDRGITPEAHRRRWVEAGMPWWSRGIRPPADWDPRRQLSALEGASENARGKESGAGYSGADMTDPNADVRNSPSSVRAAGGLVWRRGASGPELLLIRRDRYGAGEWSLPKGKLDPGEDFLTAALREVQEETGVVARPLRFAGVMQYVVRGANKVVCFWDMEVVGEGRPHDNGEVVEMGWFSREEALRRLTHEQNRELLRHLPPPPL